jgi:hypothetical protein
VRFIPCDAVLTLVTTVDPGGRDGTRLREARQTDLLSVYRIEKTVFKQPWPYAAFERLMDAPAFLVAEQPTGGPTVDPAAAKHTDGSGVVGYVVGDTTTAATSATSKTSPSARTHKARGSDGDCSAGRSTTSPPAAPAW